MKTIFKSALALIMCALLFVSCDDVEKGRSPISLPGLWKMQYVMDTTKVEPQENLVDCKDTYMYYQFNENKSYTMCYVEYLADADPIVIVKNGIWEHKRGSLDITLTPDDEADGVCKMKLEYPDLFMGIMTIEGNSESKVYNFRGFDIENHWTSWRNEVVDEAKPYVRIPKELQYSSQLFTKK
ncbi:MAG: hypothetical protein Q4C30_10030 [Bacteroidia bacterium]|nr:hypothetical protein [Bacteroidia bacterium]